MDITSKTRSGGGRDHRFPARVFYPLAFERSGYLHPIFEEFIDLYDRSCSSNPTPRTKLQLIFSVAFAITFTTASLLKAASFLLLPHSVQSLVAPHALPMPARWAPVIALTGSRSRRSLAPLPPLTAVSTDSITANLTNANSITLNACNALDPHISCHPLPPASLMPIDEGIVREGDSLHD